MYCGIVGNGLVNSGGKTHVSSKMIQYKEREEQREKGKSKNEDEEALYSCYQAYLSSRGDPLFKMPK